MVTSGLGMWGAAVYPLLEQQRRLPEKVGIKVVFRRKALLWHGPVAQHQAAVLIRFQSTDQHEIVRQAKGLNSRAVEIDAHLG